jgi:hypothetical protein
MLLVANTFGAAMVLASSVLQRHVKSIGLAFLAGTLVRKVNNKE